VAEHHVTGLEGIVSKRLGSPYRPGRSRHWVKSKNPATPAVKREAEEDWALSLGSFLRPKSKQFVVCHDP
jgi:ATP-dependent DNA ligase